MDADFQEHAHVTLGDDTQRAGPVVLWVHMIQHLVEGCHIKEVHLREELVARIAVEMTDLTHDAVGIHEPAVGGIERHADDGVLEDRPVALRHLLHLPFFLLDFRLIINGGDDVHGFAVFIFGNSTQIEIVPVGIPLSCIVVVPAVMAIGFHIGAVAQTLNEGAELLAVVGMDIVITHLYTHIIAEHRLSVQVIHTVGLQVEAHHVVAADVERHRHGLLLVKHDIHLHTSNFIVPIPFSFQSQRPCRVSTPTHSCPYRSRTVSRWYHPSAWSAAER